MNVFFKRIWQEHKWRTILAAAVLVFSVSAIFCAVSIRSRDFYSLSGAALAERDDAVLTASGWSNYSRADEIRGAYPEAEFYRTVHSQVYEFDLVELAEPLATTVLYGALPARANECFVTETYAKFLQDYVIGTSTIQGILGRDARTICTADGETIVVTAIVSDDFEAASSAFSAFRRGKALTKTSSAVYYFMPGAFDRLDIDFERAYRGQNSGGGGTYEPFLAKATIVPEARRTNESLLRTLGRESLIREFPVQAEVTDRFRTVEKGLLLFGFFALLTGWYILFAVASETKGAHRSRLKELGCRRAYLISFAYCGMLCTAAFVVGSVFGVAALYTVSAALRTEFSVTWAFYGVSWQAFFVAAGTALAAAAFGGLFGLYRSARVPEAEAVPLR